MDPEELLLRKRAALLRVAKTKALDILGLDKANEYLFASDEITAIVNKSIHLAITGDAALTFKCTDKDQAFHLLEQWLGDKGSIYALIEGMADTGAVLCQAKEIMVGHRFRIELMGMHLYFITTDFVNGFTSNPEENDIIHISIW